MWKHTAHIVNYAAYNRRMKGMKVCVFTLFSMTLLFSGCRITAPVSEKLAESDPPHQEFRGVWLTSVSNLDWPASKEQSPREQQNDAVNILDSLKAIGINAVLFQVRPESDALYTSSYDPWSYWLTGEQGRAPDPFYDPLSFLIREAHKRGMELHAWLNPYRVERRKGMYELSGSNIARREPDWILEFESAPDEFYTMLDPGLPEARDYVTNVVVDIARRYDVDGIHLDDYFYPYSPVTDEDSLTFARHHRNIGDISDWRRENVNALVTQIHDSLRSLAPELSFGISPFAIRKNADAGTNGLEGYYDLYADGRAWLERQIIDYITPQLYFETDHEEAGYAGLLGYWSALAHENERHLYAGLAAYKMLPPTDWSLDQAARQLFLNIENGRVQGNIFFRTEHLLNNPKGYSDMLAEHLHRYPALTPTMPWKSTRRPPEVAQLSASWSDDRRVILSWSDGEPVEQAEQVARYVVYRFEPGSVAVEHIAAQGNSDRDGLQGNREGGMMPQEHGPNVRSRIGITGQTQLADRWEDGRNEALYMVTAVSRNSVESDPVMIRVRYDGDTLSYEIL